MRDSGPHCRSKIALVARPGLPSASSAAKGKLAMGRYSRCVVFSATSSGIFWYLPCFSGDFCLTGVSLDAEYPDKYVFAANGEVAEWLKAAVC
jgi:hypothetical protein